MRSAIDLTEVGANLDLFEQKLTLLKRLEGLEGLDSSLASPKLARMKTSFHRKVSLRIATGNSHLDSLGDKSARSTKQRIHRKGGFFVWRAWRDSNPRHAA